MPRSAVCILLLALCCCGGSGGEARDTRDGGVADAAQDQTAPDAGADLPPEDGGGCSAVTCSYVTFHCQAFGWSCEECLRRMGGGPDNCVPCCSGEGLTRWCCVPGEDADARESPGG